MIGPAGPLFPQSILTALYVTMSVYLLEEFATFAGADGDVVMAWLVPISTREADFVFRWGWDAFESKAVELDPDFVVVTRPEMVMDLEAGWRSVSATGDGLLSQRAE